ncbi:uncharacterized protein SOCE26_093180 [Sorangium cellulosum]|uniref:Uncharacterized protein n=1 Tax=Sorangium cellulosum TaxID=56 RepID=A0A2L0F871_SORCE|nr:hypothetical protein [Sorangium cellulosum]AUX47794.1 uncharacterized protein SOCE26_093180 [Sorangium cellulosum]
MRTLGIGLVVALAGVAAGVGVLGSSARLDEKVAAPVAADAPQAAGSEAPVAREAGARAASPRLRLGGTVATLDGVDGAGARELDSFCERAGVEAEKKQAVARVLDEHRRHGLALAGHPRGDVLMERLHQHTRARVLAMLDPDEARAFDASELPGAIGP